MQLLVSELQYCFPYVLLPACDNDDVLRNIGHLFDSEVTHSSKGLLQKCIAENH